jgi:hypothetical protein
MTFRMVVQLDSNLILICAKCELSLQGFRNHIAVVAVGVACGRFACYSAPAFENQPYAVVAELVDALP